MTLTVHLIKARWRRQPWRWHAKAANGRIVATSGESYTNRVDCITAIEAVFGPFGTVTLVDDGATRWTLRANEDEL